MKTPIEVKDIRVGDRVRCEMKSAAHEFVARIEGDRDGWNHPKFVWFLLDRPTPPVDLPTEPTLGWLAGPEMSPLFDSWVEEVVTTQGPPPGTYATGHLTGSFVAIREITAFTPAVAVPKAALDELRNAYVASNQVESAPTRAYDRAMAMDRFLAAVDKANR